MNKENPLSNKNKVHLRTLVVLRILTFTFCSILGATFIALISQCSVIIVGYLSSHNTKFIQNFNNNTIASVSNKYTVYLTPSKWAFSIWGIIYFFQLIWICYILIYRLLFKTKLFYHIHSLPIYLFSFSNMLSIIWMFLWLREKLIPCFIVLLFMAKIIHVVYTLVAKSVENGPKNSNEYTFGQKFQKFIFQIFMINGLGMYASWVIIATIINLQVVLVYHYNYTETKSTFICLLIILFVILSIFLVDIFAMSNSFRFSISPYLVFSFAMVAIVYKNKKVITQSDVGLLTIVVTIISIGLFIVKTFHAFAPINKIYKYTSLPYVETTNI